MKHHTMYPSPLLPLWAAAHRVDMGCFWTMMTAPNAATSPYTAAARLCSQGGNGCHITKHHHPTWEPLLVGGTWRCWQQWNRDIKWHEDNGKWQGQWMTGMEMANSRDDKWQGWRTVGMMTKNEYQGQQWRCAKCLLSCGQATQWDSNEMN